MSQQHRPTPSRPRHTLSLYPTLLTLLSIAFSTVAVATALRSSRGHAHAAAIACALAGVLLAWRARRATRPPELPAIPRANLLEALARLPPVPVRVSAVDEAAAIRYARRLRDVMAEAKWPVRGVFKTEGPKPPVGVILAVHNVVAPPGEAMALMTTLRRAGIPVDWGHKPELPAGTTVEILIGRLD